MVTAEDPETRLHRQALPQTVMLLSAECVHIIYVNLSNVKGIVLHFGEHVSSLAGRQM